MVGMVCKALRKPELENLNFEYQPEAYNFTTHNVICCPEQPEAYTFTLIMCCPEQPEVYTAYFTLLM